MIHQICTHCLELVLHLALWIQFQPTFFQCGARLRRRHRGGIEAEEEDGAQIPVGHLCVSAVFDLALWIRKV